LEIVRLGSIATNCKTLKTGLMEKSRIRNFVGNSISFYLVKKVDFVFTISVINRRFL